ncbi:MAG: AAA family ATPase [Gemmatimonadota bacterium]|nr:AAA family ATPase [Gemmatimonadota bacterium]
MSRMSRMSRTGAAALPETGSPMPRTSGALAACLAGDREFRGIGPARAAALEAAFGEDLGAALGRKDPGVVDLLGEETATNAFAAYELKSSELELLQWLEIRGVSTAVGTRTAIRIARCWGHDGVDALKDNPYLLASFLPWETTDRVCRALGVAPDDPRRAAAAVEAMLYRRLDGNHTWMSRASAESGAARLLAGVAAPDGGAAGPWAVRTAVESGGAEPFGDGIQPMGAAAMEAFLAETLARFATEPPASDLVTPLPAKEEIDQAVAAYDRRQPHRLTAPQKAAIALPFQRRLTVLGGYAGSGKTTSLRGICELAEGFGRDAILVALSGRAAQRMAESAGRPAMTIARFLNETAGDAGNRLHGGAILIIDEASMVDLALLWQVVRRIDDASLVLVGDPAQLPPIGFGLTFHVLIGHPAIPRTILDRVMRQSAETGIPAVADAIRNGRWPELPPFRGLEPGVTFVDAAPHEAFDRIRDIGARLAGEGLRRGDAQIIAPVNAGPAGILAINRRFHELRMRASAGAGRPVPGRADIAEGDPVVWTRNDYGRNLMNGSTGRIVEADGQSAKAVIDGEVHQLNAADGHCIELAYAISVHKAQGSQWPLVIIPAYQSRILDRTLIYTAATRASEQVVLVGDRNVFRAAVERPPSSLSRDITLAARLRPFAD